MINRRTISHNTTMMQQMFVVSDCLLKLGYRDFALLAQQSDNWEYIHDFVALIKAEAKNRKNGQLLDQLRTVDLT